MPQFVSGYAYFRKAVLVQALLLSGALTSTAQLTFSDASAAPVIIDPQATTGLSNVYVLPATRGVTAVAAVDGSASAAKVYKFSNLGAAYAQEIECSPVSGGVGFALEDGDMGYMVESASGRSKYYWVTDYSRHTYDVTDAVADATLSDCDMLAIKLSGSASAIYYYTINGRRSELGRGIEVEYNTLAFDENVYEYRETQVSETIDHAGEDGVIRVRQPLCRTDIEVTGDRFLKAWGEQHTVVLNDVAPGGVEANTKAEVTERDSPNEKKEEGSDALGGSAPCEITFTAAVTDAAAFHQWQIARDEEFNIVDLQYNELDFTYVFREQGYSYVRFVASDENDVCQYYGDVYTVYIGDSRLECPNIFSPGASEGVNDEWRVSYKSIVSFQCDIFNRWGVKVASLSDPSKGWDGRYKGKLVPAGVYFYVIKAQGADDKAYNLSGDINVINYKGSESPSTGPSETP